jgi:putative ABC transport system permease protein
MLRNYIKIAFRNLWRNKGYSLINLLGLSVGLCICYLIFLYVKFEKSYDSFHDKADRIYRVVTDTKTQENAIYTDRTGGAIASSMQTDFPEVESFVRIKFWTFLVRYKDKKFQEEKTFFAEPSFFSIFSFPLLKGNSKTALEQPFSVILSESAAKKYFGTEDPIGKSILLAGRGFPATVTGIMKDFPENSYMKADMLVSMSTYNTIFPGVINDYNNLSWYSFILLKEGANADLLASKLPQFINKYSNKDLEQSHISNSLHLESLKSIYLNEERRTADPRFTYGSISNIRLFTCIAAFILFIACINFINLSTARASERAKEVGIKKVIGVSRKQLILQFLGESLIISIFSFLVSVFLIALLLPEFNTLSGKMICPGIWEYPQSLLLLFLLATGIGLLAGFYPALVLSSFKPGSVLKGRFASSARGLVLRRALVVLQFTVSIVLITGTIIVYEQLQFMRRQDLGFNKDQILVMNFYGESGIFDFEKELKKIPGVLASSRSGNIPGYHFMDPRTYIRIQDKSGSFITADFDLFGIDFDFLSQYGMPLVAGRNFSKEFRTDSAHALLVNETMVRYLGYSSPEEIIGKNYKPGHRQGNALGRDSLMDDNVDVQGRIIGVVKDFHSNSLKEEIRPLLIGLIDGPGQFISITIKAGSLPGSIASIKKAWEKTLSHREFSFFFVDETFNSQYLADERFGSLFFYFAVLAIFISCLGLLGLSSYSILQRTKEIGIRKILGASVAGIVGLLSREFIRLVLIAFVAASIISWYAMSRWLQDYAYRITISWWIYLSSGLLALLITVIAISAQAVKSARANPVKSLRTE